MVGGRKEEEERRRESKEGGKGRGGERWKEVEVVGRGEWSRG